ncbi:LacI family DNA-binding transcriptional regulator [Microbacterium murale]|uniref:LacI family transcriptional regulator n=1 Tax=Microbacterium murale TaxID=1081040 RepID=A0ABQ1S2M7_9MICO|nr:LacI family DNA-binding transcriptional regulator [Microbacterium murale]GGD87398.1 LacI family transcriptional regulator [Microbacterium murale]
MDDTSSSASRGDRPPTIKDVAARAQVSWRTVSNVIHGHRYLRPETKAKVEAAIAELGYRPQAAARQLRSGRSNLLTLAIPSLAHPYFANLAHAVVAAARREGYDVMVDETLGQPERERRVARGYGSIRTDGIIFSPLSLPIDELLGERDSTPLVLLGEHTLHDAVDNVVVDNVGSSREATEHLISLGRSRIGFVGYFPQGTLGTGDLRFTGYKLALESAGLPMDPRLVIDAGLKRAPSAPIEAEGDYWRQEGHAIAESLIGRIEDFDAIMCATDLLAIGMLYSFRQHSIRVPEDVAIVGWDDIPESAFSMPTLTTVSPNLEAIAELAVRALLRRISDPAVSPVGDVAGHRLIVRESTAGFVRVGA